MKLLPLCEFESEISEVQEIGETPFGEKKIYVVAGGPFWGDRLRGHAKPGGADWMTIGRNGLARLDVRKTFETDDGALIYVAYQGLYQFDAGLSERVAGQLGYGFGETLFKVQMQFETGDPRYAWLNTTLAVAEGRETGANVHYRVFSLASNGSDG